MDGRNHSLVTEFVLKGFTGHPEMQVILFTVFLVIYVITLMGNLGMIVLIKSNFQLHTPMYFFLCHLAFVDACYSSVVTPKMMVNFLAESKVISFTGCAMQFCFYAGLAGTEYFLLSVMAYDRYVAICKPLLYTVVMSRRMCICLVSVSCGCSFLNSVTHIISTFQLPFCGSNAINNLFCDITPLLKLSCASTQVNEIVVFASACLLGICSCLTIFLSYFYILSSLLRIHSSEGRRKAFSTCTSHLMAVTVFYGALLFIYLRPSSSHTQDKDKVASVFYTVIIPMLNPMIYSLRNKEVKDALRKALHKHARI